jgi:broad specificity phosphatase PhoE
VNGEHSLHWKGSKNSPSAESRQHRVKRRKHNVIIHSSPFLRCIQTSIAISAGLGQFHGLGTGGRDPLKAKPPPRHASPSQRNNHEHGRSPMLSAIPEPDEGGTSPLRGSHHRSSGVPKVRLRLDAFLGEWLSPDYYECITPPPGSTMMIASAKADLLRPGDVVLTAEESTNGLPPAGNFPGGWGSSSGGREDPLSSMSKLAEALPKRDRAGSHSVAEAIGSKMNGKASYTISTTSLPKQGYIPPVPSYAISPSDPIPPGYVAHARDACLEVDYQWDSMRPPQDWGSGGEYGEEWSSMHRRFRKGLQDMISWYTQHPDSRDNTNGHTGPIHEFQIDDDDETDTVLILVTHGAGCNALIGALTNQPVLLDVGMASLTMAVRKSMSGPPGNSFMPSVDSRRRSSIDAGIPYDYDVRLVASTDHLRAGSSPLVPSPSPRSQPTSTPYSAHPKGRYRSTTTGHPFESPSDGGLKLPEFTSRKTLQRSSSSTPDSPGSGLWSKSGPPSSSDTPERKDSPVVDGPAPLAKVDDDEVMPLPPASTRQNSQVGLWGAAPLEIARERDEGPKRRWSMGEQVGP